MALNSFKDCTYLKILDGGAFPNHRSSDFGGLIRNIRGTILWDSYLSLTKREVGGTDFVTK